MTMKRRLGCSYLGILAAGLALTAAAQPTAAQDYWEPEQPVELVIMAGKGGGADKMARMFVSIIENEELSYEPFEPVNMPGGSGAEAMTYMNEHAGDPHKVMVTLNSFYTTPLRQPDLGIDIGRFTPLGRMAEDTFVLWVKADSEVQDLEDFVAAAKAAGAGWQMAGTGTQAEDQLLTDFLNSTYGLEISYLPFDGGGDVATELAQGRVNSTVNNPSEQEDYYLQGATRPIAAFTPERLEMFPDVLTFREMGADLVYLMQRSVVGPPDMPEAAVAYYQELFRAVYESKEWQDYMNQNSLRGQFASGDALRDYWLQELASHRQMLASKGQLSQ